MKVFTSRKVGLSHLARHMPCQDYAVSQFRKDRAVFALSDGHSCAIRAAMSSRIACSAFLRAVNSGCSAEALPAAVKDSYDRLVEKHQKLHPLTKLEQEQLDENPAVTVYGATLLGAVLRKSAVLLFQIGDGHLAALGKDGILFSLPEDADCILNFTSSICYPREHAIVHMRCGVYEGAAAGVVLCSDGYQFSGSQPWQVLSQLCCPQSLPDKLPDILAKGVNGDDQTLLIAYDEEVLSDQKVQTQLAQTLERGRLEAQYKRLLREKAELSSYLNVAVKRYHEMSQREKDAFLQTIYPRKLRFDAVLAELSQITQRFNEEGG